MTMRPLYALTFQTDGDRLDDLTTEIHRWLASKYAGWDKELAGDGTPLALGKDGHEARFINQALPGGKTAHFTLTHPDRSRRGLHWHTALELASDGAETECDVVLSSFVTRDGVSPPPARDVRPPFLGRIAAQYPLRISREPLALQPDVAATLADAEALADVLLSPKRRLPLVLVSDLLTESQPLVHPAALQKRLLGSARVVHIREEAGYALTDVMGTKRLSCYDGGVRIYWPGFTRDDDPYFHKLYLRWEIEDLENGHGSLADDLFDRITTTTAIRSRSGQLLHRLRESAERERLQEAQRLRDELAQRAQLSPDDQALFDDILGGAQSQIATLAAEKSVLEDGLMERDIQIEVLQRELRAARDNIRDLVAGRPMPDAGEEPKSPIVMRLSARARAEYEDHPDRQKRFDALLERLSNEVVRTSQASRCPGGGYVGFPILRPLGSRGLSLLSSHEEVPFQ